MQKSYCYKTFETYNGNSRKTRETIHEATRCISDRAAINEFELNGARITNSGDVAEGLNKCFIEIGPELSRDKEKMDTSFSNWLRFQRVTQLLLLSQLNKYKRKAAGLDSVSARLLRECPHLISE